MHRGFYKAQQAILIEIIIFIQQLQVTYTNYTSIVVSGHSFGGALAILTALDLIQSLSPSNFITAITFGAPKVGNQATAQFLSYEIHNKFRITHLRDIVPHLPLDNGYQQMDGEWYLQDKKGIGFHFIYL